MGSNDGEFAGPYSVAIDSTNGFIYVADGGSNQISKINASTGAYVGSIGKTTATTGTCPAAAVAPGWCTGGTFGFGSTDGAFFQPRGIAVDPQNGFLYVSDTFNYRIQKFTLSTGAFVGSIGRSTATTGTCPAVGVAPSWCTGGSFGVSAVDGGFNTPIGIAVDAANDLLYIVDSSNHAIRKVTLSTGAFIASIGNTTATSGTCPAAGAANAWCTGGTFATGAGDGMFASPINIAVNTTHGYLYVVEAGNSRVQRITLSSGASAGAIGNTTATTGTCPGGGSAASGWCTGGTFNLGSTDGKFSSPYSLAIGISGDVLYVADTNNNRIQKFVLSTGAVVGSTGRSGPSVRRISMPAWCR
jgi:DNA-binding beta-propeller fold protein YncE